MLAFTGIAFIISGFVMKIWPPKKINSWYGYRTPLSTSSEQAWHLAQAHSTNAMFKYGLLMILSGLYPIYTMFADTYFPLIFIIEMFMLPVFAFLMIYSTHNFLTRKLNK